MLGSRMWVLLDKQQYCGRNELFAKKYTFWLNDSDQCMKIIGLGIANRPSLDLTPRQPIRSDHYHCNCCWQKISNWQCIEMSINGALMIIGLASTVIEMWFGCCYGYPTYWQRLYAKDTATRSLPHSETECQPSVNNCWLSILGNLSGDWLRTSINEVVAAIWGINNSDMLPAPFWNWVSMERQRLLVLHLGNLPDDWLHKSIYEVVASLKGKTNSDTVTIPSRKWASKECQRWLVFHVV